MRRLSITALLAVPFLCFSGTAKVAASPPGYEEFGLFGHAFRMFPHMHQHGPLYNYGPYYGYYPFYPYGPWDAYLRYDPYFYGDPYANWRAPSEAQTRTPQFGSKLGSGGFWHASWLHGGWFRGHTWLSHSHSLFHKGGCTSCGGGVAQATSVAPTGDPAVRYSGFGSPAQSAVFYSATPTLNPVLDLVPTAGKK